MSGGRSGSVIGIPCRAKIAACDCWELGLGLGVEPHNLSLTSLITYRPTMDLGLGRGEDWDVARWR